LTSQIVDKALDFIKSTSSPSAYTFAPLNEACDTGSASLRLEASRRRALVADLVLPGSSAVAHFGSPQTVSAAGTDYINSYVRTVLMMIKKKGLRTELMLGDSFMGASYWSPFYNYKRDRVVIDSHFYYLCVLLNSQLRRPRSGSS